jgi:hypothetical protein
MKRLIPLLVLAAMLTWHSTPAQAVTIRSATLAFIACAPDNSPRFDIAVSGDFVRENVPGADRVYVTLFDGIGQQITYATAFDWRTGEVGQTRLYDVGAGAQIPLLQVPAENPIRAVVSEPDGTYITETSTFSFCTFPTIPDRDGRISLGSGTVFVYTPINLRQGAAAWGAQGPDLLVYAPYPDVSRGFEVIRLPARRLREALPRENTLIASSRQISRDGWVNIYRLTTGEIQINVGPNQDGLVQVFIVDGAPPRRIYGESFYLNR